MADEKATASHEDTFVLCPIADATASSVICLQLSASYYKKNKTNNRLYCSRILLEIF